MGRTTGKQIQKMKVLVLLAILGTCAAKIIQNYNSYGSSNGYNAPSNSYNAPSSYSSGGTNSGFSGSRGGSFGFPHGKSGFGGFGFSNGNNGASGFDSSRSYGPLIHIGGNQNSGYGSNSGSSRFG